MRVWYRARGRSEHLAAARPPSPVAAHRLVMDAADAKEPDADWTGYSKMLEARVYLGFGGDV